MKKQSFQMMKSLQFHQTDDVKNFLYTVIDDEVYYREKLTFVKERSNG